MKSLYKSIITNTEVSHTVHSYLKSRILLSDNKSHLIPELESEKTHFPTDHWIEIDIRDCNNDSFIGLPVSVKDASGVWHYHTLSNKGVMINSIQVPGRITLNLTKDIWFHILKNRRVLPKEMENINFSNKIKDRGKPIIEEKEESSKLRYSITCGDVFDSTEGIYLAKHQQAGALDAFELHTGNSYILTIGGFYYRTLRVGVFFDGTASNGFQAQQNKAKIETWLKKCENESSSASYNNNTKACHLGQLPLDGSHANDETNIFKAYTLYQEQHPFNIQAKVYIEGVGSETGEKDSLILGQALSLGSTSILAKVQGALHQDIPQAIETALKAYKLPVDGIECIEFDVFGFSRGAASARHLLNRIYDRTVDPLIHRLKHQRIIPLIEDFDFNSDNVFYCHFAGLLDTVESAPFTKNCLMHVHEKHVKHLVHICAEDECRYFFPVTGIANNKGGEGLQENFIEIFMPGSHADIGGGYHSRHMFTNTADPCLTECKIIKSFICIENTLPKDFTKTKAYQQAYAYAERKVQDGWALEIYEDMAPGTLPKSNSLSLCVQSRLLERRGFYEIKVDIYINRVIEGEYSRIPLHFLITIGKNKQVPFKEVDAFDRRFTFKTAQPQIPIDLNTLVALWEQHLFNRQQAVHLHLCLDELTYQQLRFHYLHYSADESLVNKPNAINILEKRSYVPNPEKDASC